MCVIYVTSVLASLQAWIYTEKKKGGIRPRSFGTPRSRDESRHRKPNQTKNIYASHKGLPSFLCWSLPFFLSFFFPVFSFLFFFFLYFTSFFLFCVFFLSFLSFPFRFVSFPFFLPIPFFIPNSIFWSRCLCFMCLEFQRLLGVLVGFGWICLVRVFIKSVSLGDAWFANVWLDKFSQVVRMVWLLQRFGVVAATAATWWTGVGIDVLPWGFCISFSRFFKYLLEIISVLNYV